MTSDIAIGLNAVIVAVEKDQPKVLTLRHTTETLLAQQGAVPQRDRRSGVPTLRGDDNREALPFGPFDPQLHRTFEEGLRTWVEDQTDQELGYVEQLYTFGDQGRVPGEESGGPRVISISYLGLVQVMQNNPADEKPSSWRNWYHYFPYEDWRNREPENLGIIREKITQWVKQAPDEENRERRLERACITFGLENTPWNSKLVLERYELLYEAGLVKESRGAKTEESSRCKGKSATAPSLGAPMVLDHRRILATAMGRVRGKIKYRPVVFELMPQTFTLLDLQRCVEALSGEDIHKQNFRRLTENRGLVEPTGGTISQTGGRPAAEFRFRRDVYRERQALGI